jgi:hypothetical protein
MKEGQDTVAAEGAFVHHGVKHDYSYLSQTGMANVIGSTFSSYSTTGISIPCARTKSSVVVMNVSPPYFAKQFTKSLSVTRVDRDTFFRISSTFLSALFAFFDEFFTFHASGSGNPSRSIIFAAALVGHIYIRFSSHFEK